MAKQKKSQKILAEFIFWLHTVIISVMTVSGLFLSWRWVALILVVVKLQQFILHGCILTLLEAREGGIGKGQAYYQLAARRFFGIRLSRRGVFFVSASDITLAALISLVATVTNYRIHL